ncbi:MAG: hypothetical protein QOI10_2495 [Solirubrobacterales bacterium]|jgi:hypothetical protein|nr:hypothetical protein [Solirubrobacterales bacterium]
MDQHGNTRAQQKARSQGAQTQNPAEAARRELIAWCQAHQLPIPVERLPAAGPQSRAR